MYLSSIKHAASLHSAQADPKQQRAGQRVIGGYPTLHRGKEFFQHAFPHERSDLSHWRKRLGDKLELLLAESLRSIEKA